METTSGVKFNIKKTKSKMYCCVYGCNSKACVNSDVRFHYFPKPNEIIFIKNNFGDKEAVDRRGMWKKVLNIGKEISPYMQVCSLHFKKADYFSPDSNSKRRRCLKKTSVPSCNLPRTSSEKQLDISVNVARVNCRLQREEFTAKRENSPQCSASSSTAEQEKSLQDPISSASHCVKDDTIVSSLFSNDNKCNVFKDIGVQTISRDVRSDFSDMIENEKELVTLTGIFSFSLLNTIIEVVKLAYPVYNSEKRNVRSLIIMTFIKLKHNISYALLSTLFKRSKISQCRTNVLTMIDVLYHSLKEAIYFPNRNEISKNIPTCFNNFLNVRLILDCTEIFIQRPKKLCCQIDTYSQYKHTYTIKFMTGVTPGGIISFISPMFGGRISDNVIFEKSDIIQVLEKNEVIMVNREFKIDKLCKDNDITLIRPPFLKDKMQFSKEEALIDAEIAKARVHIERVNQRLKTFKVLNERMPTGLVTKGEQIFSIICAIVNLSSPILNTMRI